MMNATSNPQAAAEQARKIYRAVTTKFDHLLGLDTSVFGLDTSVSETVRAMAEKVVDQSREEDSWPPEGPNLRSASRADRRAESSQRLALSVSSWPVQRRA